MVDKVYNKSREIERKREIQCGVKRGGVGEYIHIRVVLLMVVDGVC